MDDTEQRQIARDSLFVMADLRLDGSDEEHRIKVRNLSSGGMMGEGSVRVSRGAVVWVEVRNIGWVEGSIAWVQESRFGIAFREEIDPKVARVPLVDGDHTPRHIKTALSGTVSGIVRKV
jgi:microcystin degradation protein MlrC